MRFSRSPGRRLGWIVIAVALAGCGREVRAPGTSPAVLPPVSYYLRVSAPAADAFEVTVTAERIRADSIDFLVPAWVPGRYASRGYGPLVGDFSARDGGNRPVRTRRISEGGWRLYVGRADYVAVEYTVTPPPEQAREPLAFRPRIDLAGAYTMGANVFGYFDGHEGRSASIAFDLPGGWGAATSLRPGGQNRYTARSFGDLAATPIVISRERMAREIDLAGRPHEVTIRGADPDFAPDSLFVLVEEAVEFGTRFWGRPPPYPRYLFAFTFVPPHVAGQSAVGLPGGSAYFLPELHGAHLREAGVGTLLLHQYFHAWFPGVFGPRELIRPDYRLSPRVEDAWLIEGTAEYYARILPVRYGAASRSSFYEAMGRMLTLWREMGGGDRIQPVSFDGTARSEGGHDTARPLVGGTIAAFLIDLSIRKETSGHRGLDQLLYFLRKGSPADGYHGEEVWAEAARRLDVPPATLDILVDGRHGLSVDAALRAAGLRAVEREDRRRTLGARLLPDGRGRFVADRVRPGGTAASAGLKDGDRLLQINETPIAPDEVVATRYALTTFIEDAPSGASLTLEVLRDGRRMELSGHVRESQIRRVEIVEEPEAAAPALLVRSSLFRAAGAVPGR